MKSIPEFIPGGMTARERAVTQLWDSGHSIQRIAAQLAIGRKQVTELVGRLSTTGGERDQAAIRHATAQLGAAVAAYQARMAAERVAL